MILAITNTQLLKFDHQGYMHFKVILKITTNDQTIHALQNKQPDTTAHLRSLFMTFQIPSIWTMKKGAQQRKNVKTITNVIFTVLIFARVRYL